MNDHGKMYSACIMQHAFDTNVLISPAEVSTNVIAYANYNFDAYNVTAADDLYWDPNFRSDLSAICNVSYGTLHLAGTRKSKEWKDTYNSRFVVLGNRGVQNGSLGPEYNNSKTLQIHGGDKQWEGNVCFNDNHVAFENKFQPDGISQFGNTNPLIDEFRPIGDDLRWPVADGEADLVVSDWVLEHVEDPLAFVDELHRVLRPGGAFVARTVSRHSLLAAGARLVPNRLHSRVLRRFQPGREEIDVFPTAYRMNSRRDLGAVLDDRFDWTATSRSGLEQYLKRWPSLRTAAKVVEPRLPGPVQMALVVYARRRPDGQ